MPTLDSSLPVPHMALKWKYHRSLEVGASKWIAGNNWVTKYDNDRVCVVGLNGSRVDGLYIGRPKDARKYVEEQIKRHLSEHGTESADASGIPKSLRGLPPSVPPT
jgi:hypothetical protein